MPRTRQSRIRLCSNPLSTNPSGGDIRFSDTNVESGLPKNGESFVSAAVRRLGNGQGQVQRVGVVVSPSVGSPNALTGVTSYTSNGAPPEVGAP
jgi:hypothetical protein